jgi:hypothetical protein
VQPGYAENYLELDDLNNERKLVASCPTEVCNAGNFSCIGQNYSSCSDVVCIDACVKTYFNDSEVTCQNDSSFANALFENSRVLCNETKACSGATFINSAVECQLSVDDYTGIPCDGAILFQCNCCSDAWACPLGVPSCFDDEYSGEGSTDIFCASTFLGRTCKDWGNPICDDSSVESMQPIHPADECSAGQEMSSADYIKVAMMKYQFHRVLSIVLLAQIVMQYGLINQL